MTDHDANRTMRAAAPVAVPGAAPSAAPGAAVDPATGAWQPANFLQFATTLITTATKTAVLVVVACDPSVAPERIRNLVQQLTPLGQVGKLGPRASLRVLASTQRAIQIAVMVLDQAQHQVARAVAAALVMVESAGFTAAIYARCAPTTFSQLRSDAEALLEVALENGQTIETNQFADRAPPPALNALAFCDAMNPVEPHSVRGHALLFRFCRRAQPTHWIRVHTDGDLEFHSFSDHDAAAVVAVPRLTEPAQLLAIANAWRSFICHAEVLEISDDDATAGTADNVSNTSVAAADDATYWLEAFTHGTRGRAAGLVRATASVATLLATITAAVATKRNA